LIPFITTYDSEDSLWSLNRAMSEWFQGRST
jgi:hypothetical protein